jgi:phosphoribosylamine--glycine ligase / phosphoribosylformylglycinamidine cyclo-ligase
MRILVVGSGGREHALTWKLLRSPRTSKLFVAPGNGGTGAIAENVPVAADDITSLTEFAKREAVDLTFVGPEVPLVAGIVDAFQDAGLRAFGPTAAAAQLEGSKAFAKTFMIEEGIPTAPAAIFRRYEAARAYVQQHPGPLVVKASGLAAGKGVLICDNRQEAEAALSQIMVERAFGPAGDQVLLETRLMGEEASLLAFSDGKTVIPMIAARDYKRALDGDQGLNTGGMGGYAPSPHLTPSLIKHVQERVLQPAIDGMRRRGNPYVGVLYAGLMLTDRGPRVLEFNCRFGDPEAQILLPLLETDLVEIALACLEGRLNRTRVIWKPAYNVGVVLASGGYPIAYEKGKPITGMKDAEDIADNVFHAGTQRVGGRVLTDGGRVLAVTATGPTPAAARTRAYNAVDAIHFEAMQFRRDIAEVPLTTENPPDPDAAMSAYAAAGVDINAGEKAVALMEEAVRQTYTPAVLGGIGAFGGSLSVRDLSDEHDLVLVASTDGVGTKTMIAEAVGVYDTVGQDIVNHCVNDILVQGARPLVFLDYIAAAKLDPQQIATIVSGCAKACHAVGAVLIGGETAEMPGVYQPGAFDLVGTMVGWVDRDALVDGSQVQPGDVCLGLPSSGLHTNGFSLARRVFEGVSWDTVLPELGEPLFEVLLTPHRAYLQEVESLWDAGVAPKAMSHITGGAFIENLPRVLPEGVAVEIDTTSWDIPPIFRIIQDRGNVSEGEMFRIYNMGIGLVLILASEDVPIALHTLPEARVIGKTVAWEGSGPRVHIWG